MKLDVRVLYSRSRSIGWRAPRARSGSRLGEIVTRERARMGLSFDVLRDYVEGDDVRSIDWKSSARTNKLVVRSYQTQRHDAFMIAVDGGPTMQVGSRELLKCEAAGALAVTIAGAAERHGDAVGGWWISEDIRTHQPVRARATHASIVPYFAEVMTSAQGQMYGTLLHSLNSITPARVPIIVISDGLHREFIQTISVLSQQRRVVCIRVIDPVERMLPDVGVVAYDVYGLRSVSGLSSQDRARINGSVHEHYAQVAQALRKRSVPVIDYLVGSDPAVFIQRCCDSMWRGYGAGE